jgi:cell division protein FtsB
MFSLLKTLKSGYAQVSELRQLTNTLESENERLRDENTHLLALVRALRNVNHMLDERMMASEVSA